MTASPGLPAWRACSPAENSSRAACRSCEAACERASRSAAFARSSSDRETASTCFSVAAASSYCPAAYWVAPFCRRTALEEPALAPDAEGDTTGASAGAADSDDVATSASGAATATANPRAANLRRREAFDV